MQWWIEERNPITTLSVFPHVAGRYEDYAYSYFFLIKEALDP